MASGVKVSDDVISTFTEMKMKPNCDPGKRIRVATFVIDRDSIVVEEIFREEDVCGEAFNKFSDMLKDKECRYILYDCHYETKESVKEDVVFIAWCSDAASIKLKMLYASSKDYLKKVLVGAKCGKTLNDMDCKCMDEFASMVLDQRVKSIEGKCLGGGDSKGKGRKH